MVYLSQTPKVGIIIVVHTFSQSGAADNPASLILEAVLLTTLLCLNPNKVFSSSAPCFTIRLLGLEDFSGHYGHKGAPLLESMTRFRYT